MSCPTCNDNFPLNFSVQNFLNSTCSNCSSTCISSALVCYTGPNLACSGILSHDTIEDALTKIDTILCASTGNYSAYQMHCLPAFVGTAITSQAAFVSAITDYACITQTALTLFTGTTYTAYVAATASTISGIINPALICASAGVISGDTLSGLLTKYCTKFGSIDAALNLSSVNFASCFTVVTPPTTVITGFQELISQICQVKTLAQAAAGALPVFNNVGSCLGAPLTTTDSLVSTINKIKTSLCLAPSYVSTNVTWGCVGTPTLTTLESGLQQIVNKVNILLPKQTTFGSAFSLTPVDVANPCLGVQVNLIASPDRFVASNSTDTTPGTLADKLIGNGITIDATTTPGNIILINDHKILSNLGDTSPNYLISKINGSTSNGITITPTYNVITGKVDLILSVDPVALCTLIKNCASAVPCTSYIVTPATTSILNYTNCAGYVVNITISGATTICAKLNSVYAPGATIVNNGACIVVCAAPTGLVASAITSTSFVETWGAVAGAVAYSYRLNGGAWVNVGTALTANPTGLSPNVYYSFEVGALVGGEWCTQTATNSVSTIYNFEIGGGYGMTITSISGTGIPSMASSTTTHIYGYQTGITGNITVNLTGTILTTTKIVAYKNGVVYSCLAVTGAGSFLLPMVATSSDLVLVVVNSGVC